IREVNDDRNLELISLPVERFNKRAESYDMRTRMAVQLNSLFVPAASLQFPIFSKTLPAYVNFGATASSIGAELFHSIDGKGRNFDSANLNRDWFTGKTGESFDKASQCYVDQYSSYSLELPNGTSVSIDGKRTVLANLADHQGLEIAFKAWKESRVAVGGGSSNPLLPGLEGYTSEQLFFISFAMRECGNFKNDDLSMMAHNRRRLPPQIRVKGALSNSKDFAKAFKCWRDSPMNPAH
ncbi:hypothetical protein HDU67_005467, partial [Dinochytrium kinnereticum]